MVPAATADRADTGLAPHRLPLPPPPPLRVGRTHRMSFRCGIPIIRQECAAVAAEGHLCGARLVCVRCAPCLCRLRTLLLLLLLPPISGIRSFRISRRYIIILQSGDATLATRTGPECRIPFLTPVQMSYQSVIPIDRVRDDGSGFCQHTSRTPVSLAVFSPLSPRIERRQPKRQSTCNASSCYYVVHIDRILSEYHQ
uniref:Uncharacterized protein n=2 Tax=Schizaphis graminum TaxID=13262 RepID=A0A2S2NI43_SCHGA